MLKITKFQNHKYNTIRLFVTVYTHRQIDTHTHKYYFFINIDLSVGVRTARE